MFFSLQKLLLIASLLFATSASAVQPKAELLASWEKFAIASSWKARMLDLGKNRDLGTVEYQKPDRWRVSNPAMPAPSVIVAGKMHMQIDGRSFSLPAGKMLDNFKWDDCFRKYGDSLIIQSVADDVLDSEAVRKFVYTQSKPSKVDGIAWVSKKTGQVMRLHVTSKKQTMQISYSNFNDPKIQIGAP
jgi:hypothetical protein